VAPRGVLLAPARTTGGTATQFSAAPPVWGSAARRGLPDSVLPDAVLPDARPLPDAVLICPPVARSVSLLT